MQYQRHDSQQVTTTSCRDLPLSLWAKETPNTTPPSLYSLPQRRVAVTPSQLRHPAGGATHPARPAIQHSLWRGGRGHPIRGRCAARAFLGCCYTPVGKTPEMHPTMKSARKVITYIPRLTKLNVW